MIGSAGPLPQCPEENKRSGNTATVITGIWVTRIWVFRRTWNRWSILMANQIIPIQVNFRDWSYSTLIQPNISLLWNQLLKIKSPPFWKDLDFKHQWWLPTPLKLCWSYGSLHLFSCLHSISSKPVITKVNNSRLDLGSQQRPSKWHHREWCY